MRPSSSGKWSICTQSYYMEKLYPDTTSTFAKEGTDAHEEADKHLNNKTNSDNEHIQEYLDIVRAYTGYVMKSEYKVDMSKSIGIAGGTADCVLYKDGHLVVIDLKYGKGIPVSSNSRQLKLYSYAVAKMLTVEVTKITGVISQPRKNIHCVTDYDLDELEEEMEIIRQSIKNIKEFKVEYRPNWGSCVAGFCKHRANCPYYANNKKPTKKQHLKENIEVFNK